MTPIRAMTFNINGAGTNPEKPEQNWANRADLTARLIRRYSPDLIGFQEVEPANFEFYRDCLTEYAYTRGLEYDEGVYAANSSIFWKIERFKLNEAGQFWFSRTPDVRSSDWGVPYPMGATWVRLEDRESGAQLLRLNTHFEDGDGGEQSRVDSSQLIVAHLAQLAPHTPVVITGDFNCNPSSVAHNIFLAAGFIDTFHAAAPTDSLNPTTFHGYQGKEFFHFDWGEEQFWRIDRILTRNGTQRLQTTASIIVRDVEPPVYPSDHYPVVSEFVLLNE